MKDRNYYRTLSNKELHEEAVRGVDVDWQELAVVLAERLVDADYGAAWSERE